MLNNNVCFKMGRAKYSFKNGANQGSFLSPFFLIFI